MEALSFTSGVVLCLDSMGTKLGGKPPGKAGFKKQFKPYDKTQKKGDAGKKKFGFTKQEGHGFQKRKREERTDEGRSSSVAQEEVV